MMDVVLEVFRTGILLLLVIYLWRAGREHAELSRKGWRLILAGSCLLLLGSAVDVTDNFAGLNRFQVVGDTTLQAFFEKIVGSLLGFLLLTFGVLRWLPTVTGVERTELLVSELAETNRQLRERTDELESEIAERNHIKEALRQSEEQYRAIFESTTECLFVTNPAGVIVEANPAACRTYGYAHDELVGLDSHALVHPDYHDELEDLNRQLQRSDRFFSESLDLRKDGTTFDVEVRGTKFVVLGKPHLLMIIQDVTKRKQVEEALRESRERFALAMQGANDGLWDWDLEAGKVYYSPRWKSMLGYEPDQIGDTLDEWKTRLHPDDLDRAIQRIDDYRKGRAKAYSVEFRMRHLDGHWVDILSRGFIARDDQGKPTRMIGTHVDISERKAAEQAIADSNSELKAIYDSMLDGVVIADIETKRFLRTNPAIRRMLGYSPEETLRMSVSDAHPPEAMQATLERFQALAEGAISSLENLPVLRKDGTVFYVDVTASPVTYQGRRCLVGLFRDITQRKESEEALDKLNRELEERVERRTHQLQNVIAEMELKNAELERFAYTVSHDLKSPLITIKGYLGLLQQDLAEGNEETANDDMRRISNAADKMHELLRQVLELSRIGRVTHPAEDVAMDALAREAVAMLDGALSKAAVDIQIADDLPVLHGDPQRLLEVVQNLVENAVKYMGDQSQPCIEIGSRNDGDEVVCFVRDNGLGIDPAYHSKVFGLFDQLDQKVEGSGVGLAIVKRIIEIHGGRIWVESEGLGKGTTFCFTMPTAKRLELQPRMPTDARG